jgi:two-component system sensor histidine kinase KdpD
MTARRRAIGAWVTWIGILWIATAILVRHRSDIDQSHVALTLLLVVIGGSVSGGRPLGLTLACVGFGVIDYYFQPPFASLSINKPLDGVLLVAFLTAAGVTTELLSRARQAAARAELRAGEVESLSKLGAATLRRAEPKDALDEVTALVRETIGATQCVIFVLDDVGTLVPVASSVGSDTLLVATDDDVTRGAEAALESGLAVLASGSGEWTIFDRRDPAVQHRTVLETTTFALSLRAEDQIIGVMVVRGHPMLTLDLPKQRFLFALAYYAALGVERMRLVEEAAQGRHLAEANDAKDKILASVSHDLRTPLTTIKVLAQGAESRGDPAASSIVEQADRLERMVADLLELSRLRAGQYQRGRELNTVEDVVGAALRRAQGILGDRMIVPHIDLDSPALVGEFDFVDTLRILGNLLDNALRHSAKQGVVDLTVVRDERWLVFTVSDRGNGVDPRERERIFDAFYRPSDSRPDAGQAGLGLSIARALAELQDGDLTYAPRDGGGSEFTLRLPASDLPELSQVDHE